MPFLELINIHKVRKAILYLACIIVSLWLQTMVLSRVEILGAKPLFLPVLAVAIGLWEGGIWGGVLGLFAGAYCDMCYTDSRVLFLVLFTACGFIAGALADFLINRRFISYLILSALALLITAFCQIVPLWIFRGAELRLLAATALCQVAWSLPFAVPVYFIIKRISGKERTR